MKPVPAPNGSVGLGFSGGNRSTNGEKATSLASKIIPINEAGKQSTSPQSVSSTVTASFTSPKPQNPVAFTSKIIPIADSRN